MATESKYEALGYHQTPAKRKETKQEKSKSVGSLEAVVLKSSKINLRGQKGFLQASSFSFKIMKLQMRLATQICLKLLYWNIKSSPSQDQEPAACSRLQLFHQKLGSTLSCVSKEGRKKKGETGCLYPTHQATQNTAAMSKFRPLCLESTPMILY